MDAAHAFLYGIDGFRIDQPTRHDTVGPVRAGHRTAYTHPTDQGITDTTVSPFTDATADTHSDTRRTQRRPTRLCRLDAKYSTAIPHNGLYVRKVCGVPTAVHSNP